MNDIRCRLNDNAVLPLVRLRLGTRDKVYALVFSGHIIYISQNAKHPKGV